jgi:hypothetical protein
MKGILAASNAEARMRAAAFAKASAASFTLARRSFSGDGRHAPDAADPDIASLIRATDEGFSLKLHEIHD